MCTETKQVLAEQGSVFRLILQCRPPYCSSTRGLVCEITPTKADGKSEASYWCDLPCTSLGFDRRFEMGSTEAAGGFLKIFYFVPLSFYPLVASNMSATMSIPLS